MEPKNGRKTKLIILALIIIAGVALYFWWQSGAMPNLSPATGVDTTSTISDIQQSATSIDTGNLDQEFQSVNKDLNAL